MNPSTSAGFCRLAGCPRARYLAAKCASNDIDVPGLRKFQSPPGQMYLVRGGRESLVDVAQVFLHVFSICTKIR